MINFQEIADDGRILYRDERGRLHRENAPAVIWPDGTKMWFQFGKLHRVDGPAIEWAHGGREWRLNGKWHREKGPAFEWPDGRKSYWLNDKHISEAEFKSRHSS